MGEIRKTILGICWLLTIVHAQSQETAKQFVDSILVQEMSHSDKVILIENYFDDLPVDAPTLEDAYYAFAKWCKVRNNDYQRARFYGKKERGLRLRKYPPTDDKTKRNLYNLGYFYYYAEAPDLWAAKAYYDTLIAVSEDHEIRSGKAYRELGNIYNHWGDFQNALEHYQQSEQILRKGGEQRQEWTTLNNTLANYVDLSDPNYLEDFIDARNKINALGEVEISTYKKAKILYNTAAMYQIADRLDEAEENALKALPVFEQAHDTSNAFNSLSLLGVIEIKRNQLEKARYYFDKAHAFANKNTIRLSNISNNLGDLELRSSNFEKALDHYHDAISWVVNGGVNNNKRLLPTGKEIGISSDKKRLFGYLSDLSSAWLAYYHTTGKAECLVQAETSLSLADTTIDELFLESREVVSKLNWRKKASQIYLDAIKVAFLTEQPEKALYFMEKNKGLLLLENTIDLLAKQRANIPAEALAKEESLLKAIQDGQQSLMEVSFKNSSSDTKAGIKERLFALKNKYRKFVDSLEIIYPKYVSSKKQLTITSLDDVKNQLANDQWVISYAVGENEGYALLVSKNETHLMEIPVSISQLNRQIDQFENALKTPFGSPQDIKDYIVKAHQLFNTLLPFEGFREKISGKSLIVIPDGAIQKVPFEALAISEELKTPEAYLIAQSNVLYKYSHSLDAQIGKLHNSTQSQAVGFFPTHFQGDYLAALPYSSREALLMEAYYKKGIFTHETASKDFFQEQFDRSSIVHISTHGGIDSEGPWLAFYDDKLRLNELFFLKTQKELVVLSACKTDVGEIKKGEGVFSIKRGFFKAGARSVISTLWDVNEKASMEIMEDFYSELKPSVNKSEALRKAKLAYLEEHVNTSEASPFYWSAITLTGFDGPVNLETGFQFRAWMWLVLLVILLLLWMSRKNLGLRR
ncbi:MAG: CHAT domain-containing protein [Flavobacteriaceae bacterium]|nr:CHAT domain-containing protein [Flavobacteriaceae bacterium]